MTDEVPKLKNLLFGGDGDTRKEILAAAFEALHRHGYSELTIDAIGDEFEKSQSLIYHHYDSKDELLLDLLRFITDYFEEPMPEIRPSEPRDRIDTFVETTVGLRQRDRTAIGTLIELRAQAVHDERYREHFIRSDKVIQEYLAEDIRDGIESGVFREVDPERTATLLYTVSIGAAFRSVTSDDSWVEMNEEEVQHYLERQLYK
ncbi:MAG: TetR/AcrR family transcriptional regulator [Halobacteriales archaeon]|nr:TetR/AcrR family transcriptional regulator [Halobacteriales archaeon]